MYPKSKENGYEKLIEVIKIIAKKTTELTKAKIMEIIFVLLTLAIPAKNIKQNPNHSQIWIIWYCCVKLNGMIIGIWANSPMINKIKKPNP